MPAQSSGTRRIFIATGQADIPDVQKGMEHFRPRSSDASRSRRETMMSEQKDVTYEVRIPQQEPTKFERERRAFLRLLPQLLATHRGQYVAVHDEKVAETGADRMEIATNVWKRVGGVDLYVGLVTDEPEAIARSGVVRQRH